MNWNEYLAKIEDICTRFMARKVSRANAKHELEQAEETPKRIGELLNDWTDRRTIDAFTNTRTPDRKDLQ